MAKPAFDLMIQDLIKAYIAWCILDNQNQAAHFSDGKWGEKSVTGLRKLLDDTLRTTPDDELEEVRERHVHTLCANDVRCACHHMWKAASRAAAPEDAVLNSVVRRIVSPILRNLGRRPLVFRGWRHTMETHVWACPQYNSGIRNAFSSPDHVDAERALIPVPNPVLKPDEK